MVAHATFRPIFLRYAACLLLVFLFTNILFVLLGTTVPAQVFSFTLPESAGFEKQYKLHLMDIRSGLSPKVSDQTVFCCPTWSPDQNAVAFSGGGGETFVWDRRDGATRSLGRLGLSTSIEDWSPDSHAIISQSGSYDLYRVDVLTAEPTRLTTLPNAIINDADWSPDGKFMVFMAQIGYQEFIYRIDPHGHNPEQLATPIETNLSPKISPDSQHILFVSAQNGIPGLFVMNADGTDQYQLPGVEITGDAVASPDWSPDGTHILYQSVLHGTGVYPIVRLMKVALDGSIPQVLASHIAITGMPFCWLPDGSIVYEVDSPGSAEIRLLDQQGLNDRSLLQVNLPVYLNLAC